MYVLCCRIFVFSGGAPVPPPLQLQARLASVVGAPAAPAVASSPGRPPLAPPGLTSMTCGPRGTGSPLDAHATRTRVTAPSESDQRTRCAALLIGLGRPVGSVLRVAGRSGSRRRLTVRAHPPYVDLPRTRADTPPWSPSPRMSHVRPAPLARKVAARDGAARSLTRGPRRGTPWRLMKGP